MIDTVRGILRVRKWPRKPGTPKSALQRWWNDWFRQANRLAKYVDAASAIRAIELSKHSGFYPRDILLKAMRGRLYTWTDETGWTWYSMAAIGDISESLDVLAQTVGSVLVRAVDRWRRPDPGNIGDVLTYQGDAAPPDWQPAAGGGGGVQEQLPGTPINPANTDAFYDLDVTAYNSVVATWYDVGFMASTQPIFRLSFDGGVTFKNGIGNYRGAFVSHGSSGLQSAISIFTTGANGITGHQGLFTFENLRVGRCTWQGMATRSTSQAIARSGFSSFNSPVTHIRIASRDGSNINGGTIWFVGNR